MKQTILYTIIGILGVFVIYSLIKPPEVKVEEKIEIVQDTTTVDSLRTEVAYWRNIAENERDTVETIVEVPVPDTTDEGYNHYNPSYSDSVLTANWGLTVDGIIVGDMEFDYIIKREFVREIDNKIYTTRYVETQKTITKTIYPRNNISVGVILSAINETYIIAPKITYNTPGGWSYGVAYDINNQIPMFTISRKISIKNLLF